MNFSIQPVNKRLCVLFISLLLLNMFAGLVPSPTRALYIGSAGPQSSLQYNITSSAGDNGSVFPSGSNSYTAGTDQKFIVTPNSGYKAASMFVDGNKQAITNYFNFTVIGNLDPTSFGLIEICDNEFVYVDSNAGQPFTYDGYYYMVSTVNNANGSREFSHEQIGVFKTRDFMHYTFMGRLNALAGHIGEVGSYVVGSTVYMYYSDWTKPGLSAALGIGLITILVSDLENGKLGNSVDHGDIAAFGSNLDDTSIIHASDGYYYMYTNNAWSAFHHWRGIFRATSLSLNDWKLYANATAPFNSENYDVFPYYGIANGIYFDQHVDLNLGEFLDVYADANLTTRVTSYEFETASGSSDSAGLLIVGNCMYIVSSPNRAYGTLMIIYRLQLGQGSYQFNNIQGKHTISVTFAPDPTLTLSSAPLSTASPKSPSGSRTTSPSSTSSVPTATTTPPLSSPTSPTVTPYFPSVTIALVAFMIALRAALFYIKKSKR